MTTDWPRAAPREFDVDEDVLNAIHQATPEGRPWLDSIVIVRSGQLVWERYYNGYDQAKPHQMRSATKSVLAALVGIAIDEGVLPGLDEPLAPYLTEWTPADIDPRKLELTFGDCLRMRSGLDWEEVGPPAVRFYFTPHSLAYPLGDQPVAARAGERWLYSTVDSQLVGAALTVALGCSLLSFADSRLFGPLGFGPHRWGTSLIPGRWSPDFNVGGSELFICPIDLARFGYLHLLGGQWTNGERLISESWLRTSTDRQPSLGAAEIAATSESMKALSQWFNGYGHHWWRATFAGRDAIVAAGQYGQYCIIVPDLDAVLVQTATPVIPDELRPLYDKYAAAGMVDVMLQPTPGTKPEDVMELWIASAETPRTERHDGQFYGLVLADEVLTTAIK